MAKITITAMKWAPPFAAYHARCIDRPGHKKAVADQLAEIGQHAMEDMKYDKAG